MALIEMRQVTKEYYKGDRKITPLRDITLDVQRGEFVSFMGASGSGKTTMLNLIAGIDRPTSGSIVIDGTEITKLSRSQLAYWRAEHVGYVFQLYNLVPVLTAYENVELPLLLLPLSRAERQKRVEIAMESVGITERADHYPRQLSGGEEQRVSIARAIVATPAIIVADEPTGDLDAESSDQILHLLQRLNKELAMTFLMVTHDPRAAAVAGRQLRLDKGKLVDPVRSNGVPGTGPAPAPPLSEAAGGPASDRILPKV
jgi:putative ABC transport system ATP-binding protein